jgi:hypothetical protein
MQPFIVIRDELQVAEGVVFAAGATVVHSCLRRERDSLTRFVDLADVQRHYRGCEVRLLQYTVPETSSGARGLAQPA